MIEVAIMIEGQDGIDWPRWKKIVRTVEDSGYAALHRSDHFTNPSGPVKDALELWTSLTWLAENTERIEFGPLVTPVSFRHPVITAWQAAAVDNLAGGRLRLGLGAGWQEREHEAFGFDLLDTERRFARFEEGLEVVTRLLRGTEPASFEGKFYRLREALLLPRPARPGGPPIVIGGNGVRRTLPLAARYADEWNGLFLDAKGFAGLSARLDGMLEEAGRRPEEVRRSLMVRAVFGRTERRVREKLGGVSREDLEAQGAVVGTAGEFVERLGELQEAGAQRVMLQWLETEDLEGMEELASEVLPQL
ncbi:F420-dependent glucose-6-phosphate dehydrogenase [Rubrobacter xylanophilus DSM 9941]|uniref:LLM class F420-dependent oxidoreductase n=1 Tax=Rubrobacter xylanophilus TaxID=49319 RepID=A0A510HLB4_9ACTN|nr:LLM class F420-dependent oxidoreductase [Rubrobacter xylanophilus]QYJ16508.1 F420-dependent glucose-6-phosphate dehydrogenase [Rubrobacter xylanophilus DSM 9941]BBL80810.1 LLM class F420-dependent oxidoreductase [Rubrobacter xylanophilus]